MALYKFRIIISIIFTFTRCIQYSCYRLCIVLRVLIRFRQPYVGLAFSGSVFLGISIFQVVHFQSTHATKCSCKVS